jgi:hypothetical protein
MIYARQSAFPAHLRCIVHHRAHRPCGGGEGRAREAGGTSYQDQSRVLEGELYFVLA